MEQILIAVMDLKDAKLHQLKLKTKGVDLELKVNDQTCTTGCKVTVEVWGYEADKEKLEIYFKADYLKHLPNRKTELKHGGEIFDATASEVICQACGMIFSPILKECPDCGLVYG